MMEAGTGALMFYDPWWKKIPEHVRVLSFRRNFGQTAAISAGH